MRCVTTQKHGKSYRYLLRGDSEGVVMVWQIPEISAAQLQEIQTHKPPQPLHLTASLSTSLSQAWESMKPNPVGILDQLEIEEHQGKIHCFVHFSFLKCDFIAAIKLTASIYLPLQCRLVVGREDGSIIIVPATKTVMLQLLHGNHQQMNGKSFHKYH